MQGLGFEPWTLQKKISNKDMTGKIKQTKLIKN